MLKTPEAKYTPKKMAKDVFIMCLVALIIGLTLYFISNRITAFLDTEMGPFRQSMEKWY